MKVATIVGARPQFIKAAPVSRVLRASPGIEEVLIHTGQHYDRSMSAIFFAEMDIPPPDHDLSIGSGTHGRQTGRMLEAIEKVLVEEAPDWVIVYGDTNSTLAGALAAAKLHVPVAHVEAGLRSFNRRMPEELNRVLTDHASDRLYAPTETAVKNLRREGIPGDRIEQVGDVMFDATMFYGRSVEGRSRILTKLGLAAGEYVLATIHRAENTDDPARLGAIFEGLAAVASPECLVVVPLHPRTQQALSRRQPPGSRSALRIIEPVGYLDMMQLERHARLIVTDSGGVQKEAFFHRVPCITLRDETEWVELVALGWNRLLPPTDARTVAEGVSDALDRPRPPAPPADLYGGGNAADAIARSLVGSSLGRHS